MAPKSLPPELLFEFVPFVRAEDAVPNAFSSCRLFHNLLLPRVDKWKEAKQSAIAHRDHPVDERLLTPLRKCGRGAIASSPRHGTTPWDNNDDVNSYNDANNDDHAGNLVPIYAASSSASTLAPQRVEIYAEIGHLTQFCGHEKHLMAKRTTVDIQQLAEEFRNKCSVRSPSPSVSSNFVGSSLSLAQIFSVMGARVETVVISADDNASKSADGANANRKNLQEWTRQMVDKQIAFSSSPLRRLLRSVQLSTAGKVLLLILFALLPLLFIIVLLHQFVAKANNNNFINSICCCPRRGRSGGFSSSPSGGDSRRRAKAFRQANRRFIAATP
ncbi:hypothetical protein niasHS_010378 [Heterodera schachtii]|uniref:F-box domain-containing protein n=1 Tax=Heterodera schachtii TaxID=97005 RepID=A0ABD2IZK4_HETSC